MSLVPATALWSGWTLGGEFVFGMDTMVPSSDTCDFSVSLSIPAQFNEPQKINHYFGISILEKYSILNIGKSVLTCVFQ